jgi:hypothetical protein
MIDIRNLRELVAYNPDTGELRWKLRGVEHFRRDRDCDGWNTKYAGKVAFNTLWPNGYRAGHLFKKTYLAHRVAWAVHHGHWPELQIDHINGRREDNRICNLRVVSAEDNQKNVKQRRDNTSGAKGVDYLPTSGLWRARIVQNGKRQTLGRFADLSEAVAARLRAEQVCGYHPNHGRATLG